MNGRILRENSDAALALEVGVVQRALGDPFVREKDAALAQQAIDERRLAVIDVGDDRDVAAQQIGDRRTRPRRIRHYARSQIVS